MVCKTMYTGSNPVPTSPKTSNESLGFFCFPISYIYDNIVNKLACPIIYIYLHGEKETHERVGVPVTLSHIGGTNQIHMSDTLAI